MPPPESGNDSQAPTIMDGRQLFKVVKSRIPAERFQKFLKIIKALNSQNIAKEEAMVQIKNEVLGDENKDLVPTLYQILNPSAAQSKYY